VRSVEFLLSFYCLLHEKVVIHAAGVPWECRHNAAAVPPQCRRSAATVSLAFGCMTEKVSKILLFLHSIQFRWYIRFEQVFT
jgi:hypothetical protein